MLRRNTEQSSQPEIRLVHGYRFPIVNLIKPDETLLFELSLHLNVTHLPTIDSALNYFLSLAANDFPAECFLQKASIVKGMLNLVNACDGSVNNLFLKAFHALMVLNEKLHSSITDIYSDFANRAAPPPVSVFRAQEEEESKQEGKHVGDDDGMEKYRYPVASGVYEWQQHHQEKIYNSQQANRYSENLSLAQYSHLVFFSCLPSLKDANKVSWLVALLHKTTPFLFHHCHINISKHVEDERNFQLALYLTQFCEVLLHYSVEETVNSMCVLGIYDLLFEVVKQFHRAYMSNDRLNNESFPSFPDKLVKRVEEISRQEELEFTYPSFRKRLFHNMSILGLTNAMNDYICSREILDAVHYTMPSDSADLVESISKAFSGLEFSDEKRIKNVAERVVSLFDEEDKEELARQCLVNMLGHKCVKVRQITLQYLVSYVMNNEGLDFLCDTMLMAHFLFSNIYQEEDPKSSSLAQELISNLTHSHMHNFIKCCIPLYPLIHMLGQVNVSLAGILRLIQETSFKNITSTFATQQIAATCRLLFCSHDQRREMASDIIRDYVNNILEESGIILDGDGDIIEESEYHKKTTGGALRWLKDPFQFLFINDYEDKNELLDMKLTGITRGSKIPLNQAFHADDIHNLLNIYLSKNVDLDLRTSALQQLCILFDNDSFVSFLQHPPLLPFAIEQLIRISRLPKNIQKGMKTTLYVCSYDEYIFYTLHLLYLMATKQRNSLLFVEHHMNSLIPACVPFIFHENEMVRHIVARLLSTILFKTGTFYPLLTTEPGQTKVILPEEFRSFISLPVTTEFVCCRVPNIYTDDMRFASTDITDNAKKMVISFLELKNSEDIDLEPLSSRSLHSWLEGIKVAENHLICHHHIHGLDFLLGFVPYSLPLMINTSIWRSIFDRYLSIPPRTTNDTLLLRDVVTFIPKLFPLLLMHHNEHDDSLQSEPVDILVNFVLSLFTTKLTHLIEAKRGDVNVPVSNIYGPTILGASVKPRAAVRAMYFDLLNAFLDFSSDNLMNKSVDTLLMLIASSSIISYCDEEISTINTVEEIGDDEITMSEFHSSTNAAQLSAAKCMLQILTISTFDNVMFERKQWKKCVGSFIQILSLPRMPNSFQGRNLIFVSLQCLIELSTHCLPRLDSHLDLSTEDWVSDNGTFTWLIRLFQCRDTTIQSSAYQLFGNLCHNFIVYSDIIELSPDILSYPLDIILRAHAMSDDEKELLKLPLVQTQEERESSAQAQRFVVDLPVHCSAVRSSACHVFVILIKHLRGAIEQTEEGSNELTLSDCIGNIVGALSWLFASSNPSDSPDFYGYLVSLVHELIEKDLPNLPSNDMLSMFLRPDLFPHLIKLLDVELVMYCEEDHTYDNNDDMFGNNQKESYNEAYIQPLTRNHVCLWKLTHPISRFDQFAMCASNVLKILILLTKQSKEVVNTFLNRPSFMNMIFDILNRLPYDELRTIKAKCDLFSTIFEFLARLHVGSPKQFRSLICSHQGQCDFDDSQGYCMHEGSLCLADASVQFIAQFIAEKDKHGSLMLPYKISTCQFLMSMSVSISDVKHDHILSDDSDERTDAFVALARSMSTLLQSCFEEYSDEKEEDDDDENKENESIFTLESKEDRTDKNIIAARNMVFKAFSVIVASNDQMKWSLVDMQGDGECTGYWLVEQMNICFSRIVLTKHQVKSARQAVQQQNKQSAKESLVNRSRSRRYDMSTSQQLSSSNSMNSASSSKTLSSNVKMHKTELNDMFHLLSLVRNVLYQSAEIVKMQFLEFGLPTLLNKIFPVFADAMRKRKLEKREIDIFLMILGVIRNYIYHSDQTKSSLLKVVEEKKQSTPKGTKNKNKKKIMNESNISIIIHTLIECVQITSLPIEIVLECYDVLKNFLFSAPTAKVIFKSNVLSIIFTQLLVDTKNGHKDALLAYFQEQGNSCNIGNKSRLISFVGVLSCVTYTKQGFNELSSILIPKGIPFFMSLLSILKDKSKQDILLKRLIMFLIRNLTFVPHGKAALLTTEGILPMLINTIKVPEDEPRDLLYEAYSSSALWNVLYDHQKAVARISKLDKQLNVRAVIAARLVQLFEKFPDMKPNMDTTSLIPLPTHGASDEEVAKHIAVHLNACLNILQ